jgi:hypothetical protein
VARATGHNCSGGGGAGARSRSSPDAAERREAQTDWSTGMGAHRFPPLRRSDWYVRSHRGRQFACAFGSRAYGPEVDRALRSGQRLGHYREAERLLTVSPANRKALLGEDHPEVADADMRLDVVALTLEEPTRRWRTFSSPLDIREKGLAPDSRSGLGPITAPSAGASTTSATRTSRRATLRRRFRIFSAPWRSMPRHRDRVVLRRPRLR